MTAGFTTERQDPELDRVSAAMLRPDQRSRSMQAEALGLDAADGLLRIVGMIQAANLPEALRAELVPALEKLVARHHPEGLWLFGSWARCSASRRSDVDLLVMGLADRRLLDAYDVVLETLKDCCLPIQPLVAGRDLLRKHGDSPFWRTVKAEAIPLLEGCRFP